MNSVLWITHKLLCPGRGGRCKSAELVFGHRGGGAIASSVGDGGVTWESGSPVCCHGSTLCTKLKVNVAMLVCQSLGVCFLTLAHLLQAGLGSGWSPTLFSSDIWFGWTCCTVLWLGVSSWAPQRFTAATERWVSQLQQQTGAEQTQLQFPKWLFFSVPQNCWTWLKTSQP